MHICKTMKLGRNSHKTQVKLTRNPRNPGERDVYLPRWPPQNPCETTTNQGKIHIYYLRWPLQIYTELPQNQGKPMCTIHEGHPEIYAKST